MPHYADGTECKLGDFVKGRLANTEGVVAGTVISITPGAQACNAKVRFTKVGSAGPAVDMMPIAPRMAVGRPVLLHSMNHNSSGELQTIWDCEDYADIQNLTRID